MSVNYLLKYFESRVVTYNIDARLSITKLGNLLSSNSHVISSKVKNAKGVDILLRATDELCDILSAAGSIAAVVEEAGGREE